MGVHIKFSVTENHRNGYRKEKNIIAALRGWRLYSIGEYIMMTSLLSGLCREDFEMII